MRACTCEDGAPEVDPGQEQLPHSTLQTAILESCKISSVNANCYIPREPFCKSVLVEDTNSLEYNPIIIVELLSLAT